MNFLSRFGTALQPALRQVGRIAAIAGLAVTVFAWSPVAIAQPRGGGGPGGGFMQMFGGGFGGGFGGEALTATVDSAKLDKAAAITAMSADQKDAAKTLFEGYQETFNAKAKTMREARDKAMEDFRENRDPSVWEDVRKSSDQFRKDRTDLDKQFMSDVKSLLTEEQAAKWPKFERMLRRTDALNVGIMSGERIDLLGIIEKKDKELPSEVKAALTPILDQYEVDVDREFENRTKVFETVAEEARKMFESGQGMQALMGGGDTKEIDAMISKGREASVRVREVNKRYVRQVEAVLPEGLRAEFADEVKKQSFPQVYRETRATRMLTAAKGFADLDETQKAGIKDLTETYTRELAQANTDMAEATEKMEMTFTASQIMAMFRGGGPNDPMQEQQAKRRKLNNTTEESLKKLLKPEQVERLPAGGDGGEGRGGRGGAGRGGNNDGGGDQAPRRRPRDGGGNGGGGAGGGN
jgi:hypothetical protein